MVYAVITSDGVDQIVETLTLANREKWDLIRMGCGPVRVKAFASWAEAEAFEDKLKGR